jgi:hypothetical protein
MELPFSPDQFLDVFAAYNRALWPAAVALWLATLGGVVQLARGRARGAALGALLALHWAWSGLAYHALYFSAVNPAAPAFAALFAGQAGAFAWASVARPGLTFAWGHSPRHLLAAALLAGALAYPGLALLIVHAWPRVPTFGVPCPTTLFTAGCLLAAVPPVPRWLLVIPALWSLVGGSAAFLLGITPDLMLFAAGAALAGLGASSRLRDRPRAR